MKPILAFDVNETLLDLAALDPLFEQIFTDSSVRKEWFNQFIQNAFVTVIVDTYQPFGKIGMTALEMIAERRGVVLTEDHKAMIKDGLVNLPPYPEVHEALKFLKDSGFRMVTITNSTQEVGTEQLKNAGIIEYFEATLTAEKVHKLKPAREAYQLIADECGVGLKDIILIAAHSWDIAGAIAAGCNTAFIARPGAVIDPIHPTPNIIGNNLTEVAHAIVEANK